MEVVMKAKVKATGKIIDVRVHGTNASGKPISFYSLDGRDYFKAEDLEEASNNYCLNARIGYPRVMDETESAALSRLVLSGKSSR